MNKLAKYVSIAKSFYSPRHFQLLISTKSTVAIKQMKNKRKTNKYTLAYANINYYFYLYSFLSSLLVLLLLRRKELKRELNFLFQTVDCSRKINFPRCREGLGRKLMTNDNNIDILFILVSGRLKKTCLFTRVSQ